MGTRGFWSSLLALSLLLSPIPKAAADTSQNVKDAIDALVLMSVAGGTRYEMETKGGIEGGLALKKLGVGASGEIKITRSEARGLVDGLQNAMSQIASEQASAARDCMRPWIDRILKQILGDAGDSNFYMEHKIQYLLARLENFASAKDGRCTVRISLRNTSEAGYGLAIALKAEHSDGIADFWKFFPRSLAILSDERGSQYQVSEISPLGYARTREDWTTILPGQVTTLTATFSGSGNATVGKRFDLSIPVRLAWLTSGSSPPLVSNFDLYFKGISN
jgi:hypothetical protein